MAAVVAALPAATAAFSPMLSSPGLVLACVSTTSSGGRRPGPASSPATGQGLVGPSGSPILCWGESAVKLKLAGQRFTWNFLLADFSTAILGIDFLRAHNLSVDPANCRLVQTGGRIFPTLAVTSGPTASVITGASPPTSRPASAAAGVKLPSGLPAATLSVAERPPPSPHLVLLYISRQAPLQSSPQPASRQPRRRRT